MMFIQLFDMKNLLKKTFLPLTFWGILFFVAGCGKKGTEPLSLQVVSGGEQLVACGQECKQPLVVKLRGPSAKVSGVQLKLEPITAGAKAVALNEYSRTDEGGMLRFQLTAAAEFGDQYFTLTAPEMPELAPLNIRLVSGVEVLNSRQEVSAGRSLKEPVQIRLTDAKGLPQKGIPIYFSLKSGDSRAQLSCTQALTNGEGIAQVSLKTVKNFTGKYEILAEIGEGSQRLRAIVIPQLAMNYLKIILGVLGGLGFFLFGMTLMSDGLQQAAGDRLKNLLQMCTQNRVKAMFAGVIVTALVQSSSACSVMVIGFVNASLLTLNQAIGIILGSSIGTTLTTQIISLKLDGLALPAVTFGVVWLFLEKERRRKAIASTVLGFGILFYGMVLMSSQLANVSEFPTFINFFRWFDCTPAAGSALPPIGPIIGAVLVGTVMTMIVQSSAATIGICIALAETGLLNFYTAIPLILGDNIGTTITGLLASIHTSRSSVQTAVANTIFKTLGVLLMLPFFYLPWHGVPCFLHLVDLMTAGDVFAQIPENIGRHVAQAHTLFNIINVAIFLPLTGFLVWLVKLIVSDKRVADGKDEPLVHLEKRLLHTPSAALSQVMLSVITMQDAAMQMTTEALYAMRHPEDAEKAENVARQEQKIDEAQRDIIDYLVELTQHHGLNPSQSASIPLFMHCVNDIERIGDRACNIFELLPALQGKEGAFSVEAVKELEEIDELLQYMNISLMRGLRHGDAEAIQKVLKLDGEAQHMTARFEAGHESRLRQQQCTVEKGLLYIEVLANLERISSHLTNVADRAPQLLPHSVTFGK